MTDRELIQRLLLIPDSEERAKFLEAQCGSDPGRRMRIEAALRSNTENAPDEDELATETDLLSNDPRDPGVMIGDYRLHSKIGEGGMGEVWIAEQRTPIRRMVALKLIKAGMDTEAALARFDLERQSLALMDHPNIARVFDAGMAPRIGPDGAVSGPGLPFFVMELVQGMPLTRFCDDHRLSVEERLRLFISICNAVQHAHQKGIVHRDLKPGNILVTSVDGQPVPKVIDFGVAKAIAGGAVQRSMETRIGAAIGTLDYMAPEQAEGRRDDVDTRADVFSLGVILYEVLTGLRPHDARRLRDAAFDEILRIIREEEPTRPSARIASGDSAERTAAIRRTDAHQLLQMLKGDLDWVVLKCLEKDRNRRYDSASALASDIRRFLDHEPVEARAPSSGYVLGKFLKRHRQGVIAASAVGVSLILGFAGTAWQLTRAIAAERRANRERDEKETARASEARRADAEAREKVRAENAEAAARERLAINGEILDFLRLDLLGQSEVMAQIDRRFTPKRDLTVREALDRASLSAGDRWKGRPEIEAPLRETIGLTYRDLGEAAAATVHLKAAAELNEKRLGPDHDDTLSSQLSLATNLFERGEREEGLRLTRAVLERREKLLGPEHPHTLKARQSLATIDRLAGRLREAVENLEKIRAIRERTVDPDDDAHHELLRALAFAYQDSGRIKEAIELYQRILDGSIRRHGPDHPRTLTAMANLAFGQSAAGLTRELIETEERVIAARSRLFGPEHPETLAARANLGATLINSGRYQDAIKLNRELLEIRKRKLGADHPETVLTENNLAGALRANGRFADAAEIFARLLDHHTRREGPEAARTLIQMNNLAATFQDLNRVPDAIALYEKALPAMERSHGAENPLTLSTRHNLGNALRMVRRDKEALDLFETLVKQRTKALGADHPDTMESVFALSGCYRAAGRIEECLKTLRELQGNQSRKLGEDHPATLSTLGGIAVMTNAVGNLDESIAIYERLVPLAKRKMGLEYPSTQAFMRNFAISLEQKQQWGRAADLRLELLALERKRRKPDDDALVDAMVKAGQSQLKARRFADAEKTLREALQITLKKEPDDWYRFHLESLLGECLLDQKKPEAESLLVSGFEGLVKRIKAVPAEWRPEVLAAADRLIRLERERNRPDQVAKWEKAKADLPPPAKPSRPGPAPPRGPAPNSGGKPASPSSDDPAKAAAAPKPAPNPASAPKPPR